MTTWVKYAVAILVLFFMGCSRPTPDQVKVFSSPVEGLSYVIEEYHGEAAMASDTDRVVAHFERNGKNNEIVILAGENMTVKDIRWNSRDDVTLCFGSGITYTFRNEVTFFNETSSINVRNHLDERCDDQGDVLPHGK